MMQPTLVSRARSGLRVGLLLILSIAIVGVFWLAREVFLLGFLGALVAVVFSFPVGWLERAVPRGAAVILTLVLLAGAGIGMGAAAAPTLSRQVAQLAESAPLAIRDARRWLERVEAKSGPGGEGGQAAPAAAPHAAQVLTEVGARAVPAVLDVVTTVTAAILVIVLAAFLVYRPDVYRRGARRLVPPAREAIFDELWRRLSKGLRHWVGGILVSMSIMGTLAALGLLVAGIDDWLLLGVLTFLGTFVPYLGAVASAVPGLLAALAQSPHHFLLALAVYAGVHVVEGYIVEPLVMRRAVELKPALLLFGQGVFGAVFGLVGIIVATPAIVCAQIIVDYLWVEKRLGKLEA